MPSPPPLPTPTGARSELPVPRRRAAAAAQRVAAGRLLRRLHACAAAAARGAAGGCAAGAGQAGGWPGGLAAGCMHACGCAAQRLHALPQTQQQPLLPSLATSSYSQPHPACLITSPACPLPTHRRPTRPAATASGTVIQPRSAQTRAPPPCGAPTCVAWCASWATQRCWRPHTAATRPRPPLPPSPSWRTA